MALYWHALIAKCFGIWKASTKWIDRFPYTDVVTCLALVPKNLSHLRVRVFWLRPGSIHCSP